MLRFCRERGIPAPRLRERRRPRARRLRRGRRLAARLEAKPVLLTLPIGEHEAVEGVIDLLAMKAWRAGGEGEIPEPLREAARGAREQLVETRRRVRRRAAREVPRGGRAARRTRSCAGSSPARARARSCRCWRRSPPASSASSACSGRPRSCCPPPPTAPRSGRARAQRRSPPTRRAVPALVLKTIIDRYAGTLSVFRVVSGTLHPDTSILDATQATRGAAVEAVRAARRRARGRAGGRARRHRGRREAQVGPHRPRTGRREGRLGAAAPIAIPQGVISYAISAKSKGDEDKVFTSLGRLVEEDPTLHLGRDPMTGRVPAHRPR